MSIAEIYETELVDIDKVCLIMSLNYFSLWKNTVHVSEYFVHFVIVLFCKSSLLSFQAIAHYEQAGDYYKGEESTR